MFFGGLEFKEGKIVYTVDILSIVIINLQIFPIKYSLIIEPCLYVKGAMLGALCMLYIQS